MTFDIDSIKDLLEQDNIKWSGHVLAGMQRREIKVTDVIAAILSGQIIESYTSAAPYPRCLISGNSTDEENLHVVCDLSKDKIWVVTAYYPNNI